MWQQSAERQLGVVLRSWWQLGGGDFAQSWRAEVVGGDSTTLRTGDHVFIKTHANPPPRHFSTEARGLSWLADAGPVAVPAVLGVSDDPPWLALQWVEEGSPVEVTEQCLGVALAQLHRVPCPLFGREDERSTGSLGLPNSPCQSWAEFYATQRLLPLAAIAAERQALSARTLRRIEQLAERLDEHEDDAVQASRLHGDLWAGNRLVDIEGNSWLIDPACHGGHREFDLAMMRLFGGFGDACFAAYQESWPLAAGWQERIALHQLAPLIVHAIKFGSAYVGPTEAALDQYLG
ncbi:fructosamine kinase family protein [Granulosicoccus sp. 3-233]|uniref:fructosamine kinase family protein n=1 Tax=Granulosicoccus sp. 3-233 TaxID=3417969 RepID=UPI003D346115